MAASSSSTEDHQGVIELSGVNPIAAASDVTLTSEVADELLPVEPKAAVETEPLCSAPVDADSSAQDAAILDDSHETTSGSGVEKPPENETTVYIDVTLGNFAPRKPPGEVKRDEVSDQTEEGQPAEDDCGGFDAEKNLETLPEMPESDEVCGEAGRKSEETETGNGSEGAFDVKLEGEDVPLEVRIEVIESDAEDDDRDSASMFSTCDEWTDSPTNSARTRLDTTKTRLDHAPTVTSLPPLTEDIRDCIAELAEQDEIDDPPMAPRGGQPAGFVDELQAAAAAASDVGKSRSADRKSVDGRAGVASSTQPQRPGVKRRPRSAISAGMGGRVAGPPGQAGRAGGPPTKSGTARPAVSRATTTTTTTRSEADNRNKSPSALQTSERVKPAKPGATAVSCSASAGQKARKPAWK